jgi:hypothetical protein
MTIQKKGQSARFRGVIFVCHQNSEPDRSSDKIASAVESAPDTPEFW